MKYRKKPVVIEATLWFKSGDHPEDDRETFIGKDGKPFLGEGKVVRYFRHPNIPGTDFHNEANGKGCGRMFHDHGWIDTLEMGHNVCPGDWIIKGIRGEMYSCKPDIFEATYEAME